MLPLEAGLISNICLPGVLRQSPSHGNLIDL